MVDEPLYGYLLDEAMRLARAEQLSMYDGLYLWTALQDRARIATRDAALIAAAERRGVAVYDCGTPV